MSTTLRSLTFPSFITLCALLAACVSPSASPPPEKASPPENPSTMVCPPLSPLPEAPAVGSATVSGSIDDLRLFDQKFKVMVGNSANINLDDFHVGCEECPQLSDQHPPTTLTYRFAHEQKANVCRLAKTWTAVRDETHHQKLSIQFEAATVVPDCTPCFTNPLCGIKCQHIKNSCGSPC